jgi:transposase InsO family protein
MIAPNAALSVSRQCTLLGIARSSFYYQSRPSSAAELDLLNRLDRIFTEHPVYGSRRLQVALLREGIFVGRRRIRWLMRKLGLCAIRPKGNTSKPHSEHKIYPTCRATRRSTSRTRCGLRTSHTFRCGGGFCIWLRSSIGRPGEFCRGVCRTP